MVGELDHQEFQAAADALSQHIPGSTKIIILAAGHMANHDDPLEVTWEILEFCRPETVAFFMRRSPAGATTLSDQPPVDAAVNLSTT